ncbi:hypothetical protein HQ576_16825, partial [bacterium]|nr:hypothetical protein [bacterium]
RADAVLTVPCALWPLADAETLWPKCREALAKAGVKAPAEVVDADGKPVWGIEVRAAEVGGRRVVNLVNYRGEPQQVRLLVDGKPARGTDLIGLAPVGESFAVPSLMPMLIEVRRSAGP